MNRARMYLLGVDCTLPPIRRRHDFGLSPWLNQWLSHQRLSHLSLLLVLCGVGTFLTGCTKQAPVPGQGSALSSFSAFSSLHPAALHPADPSAAVRLSPLYRQAQRDCRAKRYGQAAGLLEHLATSPGLTPEQIAFCRQQRVICLHDAGRQTASTPSSLSSLPAAHSELPRTPSIPAPLRADQADCGPRALLLLCPRFGVHTTLDMLRRQGGTTGAGTSLAGLARAAQSVGLKARGVSVDKNALKQLPCPAVAWVDGNHYVALLSIDGEHVTIHDPNQPAEELLPVTTLLRRCGGILLTLSR